MQPTRKPVTMHREFLPQFATPTELASAHDSVAESMARLFPGYVYKRSETTHQGKLLVVAYTYEYSKMKDFSLRVKAWISRWA
jgi:hypothetical protein